MNLNSVAIVTDGKFWQKDLPELDDLELQVAPWDNAAFTRLLQKKIQALPRSQRANGNIDPAAYDRCVGATMAETILFDWKNLIVGGTARPFDRALAAELLTDPKYRVFRDGVIVAARRAQESVTEDEAELAGN